MTAMQWNQSRTLTLPSPEGKKSQTRVAVAVRHLAPLLAVAFVIATAIVSRGADLPAPPANPADFAKLTDATLAVFRAKCAECHGPQLPHPKKKFGYCLDLRRVAANAKFVVPFKPDQSKLWKQIDENEMPPEDAKSGAMTPEQKAVVKQWILAGAPPQAAADAAVGSVGPSGQGGAARETEDSATGEGLPFFRRLLRLIGKFHPLIAHFPIALLVGAAVAELAWLRTGQDWLTGAVRFCTLFGAAGALFTAALGWADALMFSSSGILTAHRWLGTSAALWAIPVVLLSEKGFRRRRASPDAAGEPRIWFQVMLFVGVALVGIAAHFGGSLEYGTDYLNW